ncbi:hypothetical protein Plec18167_007602 [Paecilomyces lecythidis]|uniref:Carboxylic ester hydrolase n=1 Tax=Paecilomyces lecythidis TaxID=3004212 RepID=A0ABR3X2D9_9EURO
MGRITKLSLEMGYPIIAVGVNYRVGAPGFLHSSVMADVGYKANNGLDDQRLALRWVQKHIAGFGGDPAKVTLLGESAGATAGAFHLQSSEPLFQQLIAMSGSLAQPFQSAEGGGDRPFSMIADALGAKELSPKQQLQKILDTPKEEFVSTVGRRFPIRPLVDGDTIRVSTTFRLLTDPDEVFKSYPGIQHYAKIAPTLISAYALDTNAVSNTLQTTLPILNFGNDIMFSLPARAFARAWSHSRSPVKGTESFLCHFNCPNPWDGRWKGYATHVLDLNFVLQNFREDLSRGQRESAERYARDIIAFVHGESPWDAYEVDARPGSTVYYAPVDGEQDGSRFVPDEESESTGRRDIFQKVVGEALFDELVDVWQLFMAGPRK